MNSKILTESQKKAIVDEVKESMTITPPGVQVKDIWKKCAPNVGKHVVGYYVRDHPNLRAKGASRVRRVFYDKVGHKDNTTNKTGGLHIDRDLWEQVRSKVKQTGFVSAVEFVEHAIRSELKKW